jgi:hypothetical protein
MRVSVEDSFVETEVVIMAQLSAQQGGTAIEVGAFGRPAGLPQRRREQR